ncbi:HlyD family type I secretion periplasmic adaptor subunit [Endozoicomonadaceae bacterium StTr2]
MLAKLWAISRLWKKEPELDPLEELKEQMESGQIVFSDEESVVDPDQLEFESPKQQDEQEESGSNIVELSSARPEMDKAGEEQPVMSEDASGDERVPEAEQSAAEDESEPDEADEASPEEESEQEEIPEAELEFMSDTSAAMLLKTPRGGRMLLGFMFLFMVIAVSWAFWAEVDEITRADGTVIPSSRLQVIQNLEGGILEQLFVAEGEHVNAGQPLMQLDDTRFSSDMRGGQIEYFSELARVSRLKAEIADTLPQFPAELDNFPNYVSRELALFKSRQANLKAEQEIAARQTAQSKQELVSIEAQADYLRTSHELGKQELQMTLPLADKGVVSQVELIQLKQRVNDLGGELIMAELSMPKLEQAYEEARAREREVTLKFREEALTELNEAEVKLRQVRENQTSLKDQVSRTLVRSPVTGVVKKINVTTIGGVVQPGMDLIEVVPLEDNLLVEARVNPKDIGFLATGMRAVVKFTAYDFAVYGGLEGTVDHISADTIQDEKGESYYLVRVRTSESHLGSEDNPLEIIPGMRSNIDIMTGKKTIMGYLMKPILRARSNALTER